MRPFGYRSNQMGFLEHLRPCGVLSAHIHPKVRGFRFLFASESAGSFRFLASYPVKCPPKGARNLQRCDPAGWFISFWDTKSITPSLPFARLGYSAHCHDHRFYSNPQPLRMSVAFGVSAPHTCSDTARCAGILLPDYHLTIPTRSVSA